MLKDKNENREKDDFLIEKRFSRLGNSRFPRKSISRNFVNKFFSPLTRELENSRGNCLSLLVSFWIDN